MGVINWLMANYKFSTQRWKWADFFFFLFFWKKISVFFFFVVFFALTFISRPLSHLQKLFAVAEYGHDDAPYRWT